MEETNDSVPNAGPRSPDDEANFPHAAPPARRKRDTVGAASRKRRTVLACDVCRSRRTKCDGKKPICSFCEEYGTACAYQPVREAPPTRLETDISAIRARLDIIQNALTRAPPTFAPDTPSVRSDTFGDNPSTRIPIMILNDSGFMRVVGLQDDLADELISRERAHVVPGNQRRGGLIRQQNVLAALHVYQEEIHIWFPFLHPSFKDHFLSVVSGPLYPSAESCIALIVIAIGCVAKDDNLSSFSSPDMSYANAALEMLPVVLAECSITAVQCLIAIALYYNTLYKPILAYDYIMIASLKIQPLLRLKGHDRDLDTLELMHRSFWTILLIEAELANPFVLPSSGIRDLNEHIPLPSSFKFPHTPQCNVGSMSSQRPTQQPGGGRTLDGAGSHDGNQCNLTTSPGYSRDFSMSPLEMQRLGIAHPSEQGRPAAPEQIESYYLAEIAMRRMLYRCTTSIRLQQPSKTPTYAPIVAAELAYQLEEWYYHLPACLRFDRHAAASAATSPDTALSSPHNEFLRTQFYSCRTGIYWPAAYEAIRDGEPSGHGEPAIDMFLHSYASFIKSAVQSVRLCKPNQWIVYAAIFPMTLAARKTISVPSLRNYGPPDLENCFELAKGAFEGVKGQCVSLDYLGELLSSKLAIAID